MPVAVHSQERGKIMKKMFVVLAVLVLGLSVQAVAGDKEINAPIVHPEMFMSLGRSFHTHYSNPDSNISDGYFTLSAGVQFAPGGHHWRTCEPYSDGCTEKNGPRIAFGGIGLAFVASDYRGMIGFQFPLVTLRLVRNVWVGSAVSVWPWAKPGVSRASFTASLSFAIPKDDH